MTTPAAAPAAGSKAARTLTKYVILEGHGQAFQKVGNIAAANSEAAIKRYATDNPIEEMATFIAIPARNWQPVTVTVETKTTIKLG